jgi:hypothetical protein
MVCCDAKLFFKVALRLTDSSSVARYRTPLQQIFRQLHVVFGFKVKILANCPTKTWMAYIVDGMNQSRIKTSSPFVVTSTRARFHALQTILDAIVDGRPVANFEMQVFDLFLR